MNENNKMIFEVMLDSDAEFDPRDVNKIFLDQVFSSSEECFAVDYDNSIFAKIIKDSRPKITTKQSYFSEKRHLLRSSLRGENLFVLTEKETSSIVEIYKNIVQGKAKVEAVMSFSLLPIESSKVNDVLQVCRYISVVESVICFSHDGYPVFVWGVG